MQWANETKKSISNYTTTQQQLLLQGIDAWKWKSVQKLAAKTFQQEISNWRENIPNLFREFEEKEGQVRKQETEFKLILEKLLSTVKGRETSPVKFSRNFAKLSSYCRNLHTQLFIASLLVYP